MLNEKENKSITQKNVFRTKKHLGQCFLKDENIIKKIVDFIDLNENYTVVEIGPGLGALTKELIKKPKRLIAYEIDKDALPILKNNLGKHQEKLEIINEDILKTDITYINNIEGDIICVSNLPYYITSPIIDLFLKKMTNIKKAIFMVQKEVGDRLSASVGTKDYNSFTILVNYYAKVKKIINVKRDCFKPVPNVDSVVIEIEKIERDRKPKDEKLFIKVVESSFKERRKTLINNLSNHLSVSKDKLKEILTELNIDENIRSEKLSIDGFINLSDKLKEEL